ncbi:ROK family protein [Skermania sp. ID1734]|uniref:polyphosphate--glucose phosphotransferase n=1 Tax=Skermania sp. ID1734 TaxID=2597516 RepID=UPI00117FD8D2|nr:ROK family protein [Skermania sp. ID1734]TSD96002.1 ROK family protein [Skermania sp. ID1734]
MTTESNAIGANLATENSVNRKSFGIDVGGTGVKGAIVDLETGEFASERIRLETPQPATPDAVAAAAAEIVKKLEWTGPVGITLPCVVQNGVARTAANVDKSWIGTDAVSLFKAAFGGVPVAVVNDADAAGLAEDRYGAGKNYSGVVILLTFGTGIGSAVLNNGVLLPNTEFGHIEVGGKEAEHRAANSVREGKELSWKKWAKQVSKVLRAFEDLMWPDIFIAGGGVSKKSDKWIPLLDNRTKVIPAELLNTAGIVGAAMAADALGRPGNDRTEMGLK